MAYFVDYSDCNVYSLCVLNFTIISVRKSTSARLGESTLHEDKAKRKKWTPPKFKISSKDVADLPEDQEIMIIIMVGKRK